ncbi:MAG: hypothetical protein ABEK36_01670 [Candidatus Aenigmatarchaeota archaeon]
MFSPITKSIKVINIKEDQYNQQIDNYNRIRDEFGHESLILNVDYDKGIVELGKSIDLDDVWKGTKTVERIDLKEVREGLYSGTWKLTE